MPTPNIFKCTYLTLLTKHTLATSIYRTQVSQKLSTSFYHTFPRCSDKLDGNEWPFLSVQHRNIVLQISTLYSKTAQRLLFRALKISRERFLIKSCQCDNNGKMINYEAINVRMYFRIRYITFVFIWIQYKKRG